MTTLLTIIKIEYTLNGNNLDASERWNMRTTRILGGNVNSEIINHTTVLFEKKFKTNKAAYDYMTPEFIDSLGLIWNASKGTYSTEYYDIIVEVAKA